MKHVFFCGTRRRALIALASAAAFLGFAGVANAQVLQAGATTTFGGQFTSPEPVLFPGDELLGSCPSQQANMGLINCRYFTFTAEATGTATVLIDAEDGLNFIDAATFCNGETTARPGGLFASSNAGEPGTIEVPVTAGDVCEVRVSIFFPDIGEATPFNPLTFTGSVTLTGTGGGGGGTTPPPVNQFKVTGGGQVGGGSFTSQGQSGSNKGNIRWFAPNGCKVWSTDIGQVSVQKTPDGGIATITGTAKVNQNKTTTNGVPFEARAEDHGESGNGVDRFHINLCGGVDALIDNGNIQIHPVS